MTASLESALSPVSPVPLQIHHQRDRRQFQGIPGVEITPSGKLWATWYAGGKDEGPENYVVLASSTDGGTTWKEEMVIDPPDQVRAFDPTLWIDPLGRLWWFWAQCHSPSTPVTAGVWAMVADDPDAPVWSAPFRLTNGIMMNKPTVLSNGEWALPTAVWNNRDSEGKSITPELLPEMFSNLTISADQGKTFFRRGGADVPFRAFDEHMIVERNNGQLWMLVRTKYGVAQSFSKDGGVTWSPGWGSPITGPNSRFFIRRLQSERLLLVNHVVDFENPTERKDLTAWVSEDEGQSWQGGLALDARSTVSYPDGTQDASGNIWIIYDHARYKGGDILLAVFREEDVLAGTCVSSEARLRIPVSSYPFPASA